MRINRASDDAAGLAVGSLLKLDAKVYAQGINNVNDGVSAYSIAEGALTELKNITVRQNELAAEAANGTYSNKQRAALHSESKALSDEFNRIVQTTQFNNLNLLDRSTTSISVQAGYGTAGRTALDITTGLARLVGSGQFGPNSIIGGSFADAGDAITADFNSDGHLDIATTGDPGILAIALGTGTGGFNSLGSLALANAASAIVAGDFDENGVLDLVVADYYGSVRLGNGNGTFKYSLTMEHIIGTAAGDAGSLAIGDLNGDGHLDYVQASTSVNTARIFLGNGNGTFRAFVDQSNGGSSTGDLAIADVTGDGVLDLVFADIGTNTLRTMAGNGNGTFKAATTVSVVGIGTFATGDFNDDGFTDVAAGVGAAVRIYSGSSSGLSLNTSLTTVGMGISALSVGDFNGDGVQDIAAFSGGDGIASTFLGSINGTFKSAVSSQANSSYSSISAGDFDEDGVLDLAYNGYSGEMEVGLGQKTYSTLSPYYYLRTQEGALQALDQIDLVMRHLDLESGVIGAAVSRLGANLQQLMTQRENYEAAASAIFDADVASETANLVRNQILQQAGAAVLAQANQVPALALKLLAVKE